KAMVKDYLISKGGYAYLFKNGSDIESIHYVSEEKVSFIESANSIFKDYYILVDGKRYYPHEFIKLLRSTTNGYEGKSLIKENSQVLSVAYNSLKFEENLVATGGNKKGFIRSAKHLTQEAIDALKSAWAKLYSNSTENVVILNEGLDFKESSNTSVEMQLNENKKTNGEEICKLIGTPPPMLSGRATVNDDKNFIKYEITNVLSDFEAAINKSLLLETEKGHLFFKFDIEELIKGDIDKRYEAYSIALDKGFIQIDEVRKKENMEPLGMTFVKLGLEDGLYDPVTKKAYVLNTDKMVDLNKLSKKGGIPNEN
ncbi:MAG: phage portal protein, partial [Erysipelotrichaceae bacterium]